MFTPLCTVLTTALSAAILHEELHIGRHALSSYAIYLIVPSVLWRSHQATKPVFA
jgi:hypothetical protein